MKTLATILLALGLPLAATAQTVDGNCSDAQYATISANDNSPNGFGTNDVALLRTASNATTFYICVVGDLVTASPDNGFFLFLDASGYDGFDAGNPLPSPSTSTAFFSGAAGTTLDTEADFGFFVGLNGSSNAYLMGARYGTGDVQNAGFIVETNSTGTSAFASSAPIGGTGDITQAFNNSGGATTGWELAIPLTALPGTSNVQTVRFFGGIANVDAYFSNELLPDENYVGSADVNNNFGNDPNFDAAATGNPLFTVSVPMPVELVAFTGTANGRTARLAWTTASETNNAGFVVERQTGNGWNDASALIAGHGTTTEAHAYAFDVNGLTAGTHTFRLRQVDTDGTVHYSPTATVEIAAQDGLALTAIGARGLRVESEAAATVTVVDVLGRRVLVREVGAGTSVVAMDGVSSGVYVVRAESAGRVASTRLVVR